MEAAVAAALPADCAILVAAVADWRVVPRRPSSRKRRSAGCSTSEPNPDILADLARKPEPPGLLIGFAAETDDVVAIAIAKRVAKGCDWIVANDVSGDVMGGDRNRVHLVTAAGVEDWPEAGKEEIARRLIERIAAALG